MVIPVTVSGVTCVTVGGSIRECGGGALPPVPEVVEGECQNVLKEVRGGRVGYSIGALPTYVRTYVHV